MPVVIQRFSLRCFTSFNMTAPLFEEQGKANVMLPSGQHLIVIRRYSLSFVDMFYGACLEPRRRVQHDRAYRCHVSRAMFHFD